jgi:endonuclease-3
VKKLYGQVIDWFKSSMPQAESELSFDSPFQLLVAVILSAQCTDKRVNMVTPALFAQFPTPQALSAASFDEVYALVKSVSYPNSKATHLIQMATMLCERFGGEVPSTHEELQQLPGVGRKTANVVMSIVYDKPVIAVDTHVFRVARRIGLSKGGTPLAVENDLTENIPAELRPIAHHWLILHGRYTCTARNPKCDSCGLTGCCREYSKTHR